MSEEERDAYFGRCFATRGVVQSVGGQQLKTKDNTMFILQYVQNENNLDGEYIVLLNDKPTAEEKAEFLRDGYKLHLEYEFECVSGATLGLPIERELVVE